LWRKSGSRHSLAEEQPAAHKDVDAVIDVVTGTGLVREAARPADWFTHAGKVPLHFG
jgi:RNA-splicing ligase RtcB